jgi:centrosomal protein CEP41
VFFEKGYENVYLISGGIEQFQNDFPELCEGKVVPTSKKEETKERMELTKKKHEHCKESPRRY